MKNQINKMMFVALLILLTANLANAAGTIKRIYSHPAIFTANEEVTFFFDVSDTDLAGEAGPLYLWTWSPGDPANGNGSWDNSAEHMKLTQVNGNVWSFTMTPTIFYGKPANEITEIHGLLKTKTGNKQTDDFKPENGNAIVLFDLSSMNSKIIDHRPYVFKVNEPMSIILNAQNAYSEGGGAQGQLVGKEKVSMHSGINGWQKVVDSGQPKTILKKITDNLYKLDIIPSEYWETNDELTEINCLFNDNGSWSASGRDVGGENFRLLPKLPEPEREKEISVFPNFFTMDDVVTLIFNQGTTEVEGLKDVSEIYYDLSTDNGQSISGKAKRINSTVFRQSIIPSRVFANAADITKMYVVFRNLDGSAKTTQFEVKEERIFK